MSIFPKPDCINSTRHRKSFQELTEFRHTTGNSHSITLISTDFFTLYAKLSTYSRLVTLFLEDADILQELGKEK